MRNKFVYSCSIKIHASGFSELLESIFCVLLVVEAFSLQNVVKMLEEVIVCWWEVRWIWPMKQDFVAQFIQLFKCCLCQVQLGIVTEKNWVISADQYWLQALQLLLHLINLPSIHLRWKGFTGMRKAIVDQTSSRPPNSKHDHFWWKFGFRKCFGAFPQSNHWAGHHWLSYQIHFSSHITI